MSDGRLGYGGEFTFVRDGKRQVVACKAGDIEYRRVPDYRPSSEIPEAWKRYVGDYGWPHNIMKIYVKDGTLTCLVEWFYEYPLSPVAGRVFAFPDYGLYEGETIEFIEGAGGEVTEARMAMVPFRRLP